MPRKKETALPKGTEIPHHIALILDGNRRWARARGLKPWEGHFAGFAAVKKLAEAARHMGVHTFTVWGFSTDNWSRPKEEIDKLMEVIRKSLHDFEKQAHKDKVRLIHLGRKDRFPADIAQKLRALEESTKDYKKHVLNVALDYGGKDEILRAVKEIVDQGVPSNKIDEETFASFLDTAGQPYPEPDLFIRPSGEQRTSGLLPWQMAYTEYYFEQSHLPDFTPEKLKAAILDFSRRRRRFGGSDAVEHFDFNPEMIAKLEIAWWRLRKVPQGTRLRDYVLEHLRKQYGLSKKLAKAAAKYLIEAALEENNGRNWEKAKGKLGKFYELIKGELKLAFEPSVVASLEIKLWQDLATKQDAASAAEAEEVAKELYAEVYRISLFQAAKAAHLMVMAHVERNLAERGLGERHWAKAEDYLVKFYDALKERVA